MYHTLNLNVCVCAIYENMKAMTPLEFCPRIELDRPCLKWSDSQMDLVLAVRIYLDNIDLWICDRF